MKLGTPRLLSLCAARRGINHATSPLPQVRIGGHEFSESSPNKVVVRRAVQTYIHPRYEWQLIFQPGREYSDNDYALLRLNESVTQYADGTPIQPILLPPATGEPPHRLPCSCVRRRLVQARQPSSSSPLQAACCLHPSPPCPPRSQARPAVPGLHDLDSPGIRACRCRWLLHGARGAHTIPAHPPMPAGARTRSPTLSHARPPDAG